MTQHQLIKRNGGWYCEVCLLDWKNKPRTDCAGVPVYRYHARPAHLLTEDELMAQNLKPTAEPVATCRIMNAPYYLDLYDRNQAEIAIPDLPPVSDRSERFAELKTVNQLERYNLKPGNTEPQGCYWSWRESNWVYLYRKEDCEIDNPELPPCYDKDEIPPDLKTQAELKKLNLGTEGIRPRACYRYWSRYSGWATVLLFHPDDCAWQPQDRYIAKTTLRRTYLLSDRWIKRLGNPDLVADNPHHEKWTEMKLYSRQRVEAFLAEHAEEYANWLSERDRYIAIFEQNREAIEAGRTRAVATRRQARRLRLEQLRAEEDARWEAERPQREQMVRCLRCASGCAMPTGFLCAIHPMGLEPHQLPCPDWTGRSN